MGTLSSEIEQLYRARYLTFRNGLVGMTGSYESARDVVQEAVAQASRDQEQFRGEGSLAAWVWRIAVRVALDARRNGRILTVDELVAEAALPDHERDPMLARALRQLAPRRQLIVFLRYFADLSYTEIAEVCGISEGTVAATLAHACVDLLRALDRAAASRPAESSRGTSAAERRHFRLGETSATRRSRRVALGGVGALAAAGAIAVALLVVFAGAGEFHTTRRIAARPQRRQRQRRPTHRLRARPQRRELDSDRPGRAGANVR